MISNKRRKTDNHWHQQQHQKQQQQQPSSGGMRSLVADFDDYDNIDEEEITQCQQQIEKLRKTIHSIMDTSDHNALSTLCGAIDDHEYTPKLRKTFAGHFGKIYAVDVSLESNYIASASQDGKIIIFDISSTNKLLSIALNSTWVMTCVFSRDHHLIASGGLDNTVSIYRLNESGNEFSSKKLYRELQRHEGYVSNAKFVNNYKLLSCSGDASTILWDIEKSTPMQVFLDNTADVFCIDVLSIGTDDPNLFCSGSIDALVKIYDMRVGNKSIMTFKGFESDVNCVKWFSDGQSVLAGSDDTTVRLFDIKTCKQINGYQAEDILGTVASVEVSKTGRYIFVGYDEEPFALVWDTLGGKRMSQMEHHQRVSALRVIPNGNGVVTGCWDRKLRIWA